MRTVLVTGAASWEGIRLVRRLHRRGDLRVVAVDESAAPIPLPVPLQRWSLDSLDFAHWVIDLEPDTVVHLQTIDHRLGEGHARRTMVLGAQALFGALIRLRSLERVVVKSDASIYGTGPRHPTIADEAAPFEGTPTSHERALRDVEQYVAELAAELPAAAVTVLRFVDAHADHVDSPLSRLLRLPAVPVVLGHDPLLQLISPDDVIACLEHALDVGVAGTFNVAPELPLYLSQILRVGGATRVPLIGPQLSATLRALAAGGLSIPDHTRGLLRHGRVVRIDAMRSVLGFEPTVTTRSVVEAS